MNFAKVTVSNPNDGKIAGDILLFERQCSLGLGDASRWMIRVAGRG